MDHETKVKQIIAEYLGISVHDISNAQRLENLCVDSLDVAELVLQLEEELSMPLFESLSPRSTVQQVIDVVRREK